MFKGQQKAEFASLFNRTYFITTICLTVAWFCLNFTYYGQLITLPYIFGATEKSLGSYAWTVAGEIPTICVTLLIIDRQGFGRKSSLIYAFAGSAIFHGLFAINNSVVFSTISRFFMKMIMQVLYPCAT